MSRLRWIAWGTLGVVLLGSAPAARAELLSKKYVFKPGVILELAVSTGDGVRLDTVRFQLPSKVGGRATRTGGLLGAEVAVSNVGAEPIKVGLALALFDDAGRLVGVANGGSKLAAIKPERQKTYVLIFDGVNLLADRATTFQISLETK